jgi:hypothetical protein
MPICGITAIRRSPIANQVLAIHRTISFLPCCPARSTVLPSMKDWLPGWCDCCWLRVTIRPPVRWASACTISLRMPTPRRSCARIQPLAFASGNRDPEKFENADEYQLDRAPNRHLSFGTGIHVCIGNGLARQEIRVALEELLGRTQMFGLSAEPQREFWHPYGLTCLSIWTEPKQ